MKKGSGGEKFLTLFPLGSVLTAGGNSAPPQAKSLPKKVSINFNFLILMAHL